MGHHNTNTVVLINKQFLISSPSYMKATHKAASDSKLQ